MKNLIAWPDKLLLWYQQEKRDLPWRNTKDPYAIWVSEIMLQQTRVETVKDYYYRFLACFPDATTLAQAPEESVLKLWEGLGYYSRARNLQKAAQIVATRYQGKLPNDYGVLKTLPGIGEYTAGAIASIAYGIAEPAMDGNVFRVSSRLFGERENIDLPQTRKRLHQMVADAIRIDRPGDFNQAMMELGATLCSPKAPQCDHCPLKTQCDAYAEGDAETLPVHGKKHPAKAVDMAVCLLSCKGRIAVFQRRERLLHGLYVFYLVEGENDPLQISRQLAEDGFQAEYAEYLGEATHVFTHRIWNMKLFHFCLDKEPGGNLLVERGGVMADAAVLRALPIPTAMKAAKAAALEMLTVKHM